RVEDMAEYYIREIQTVQPHGPYFFAGYSFGGTVAFEMAHQLIRKGEKIGIIAMVDSLRPGCDARASFFKRIFLHLEQVLEEGPAYLKRKLVGWKQWGTYSLKHRYKHYLQTQHKISETDEHLEVIVANTMAAEAYNYQVYPGSITLLRTEDKYRDEAIGIQYDPQFGWGELATEGVEIHYVAGDHIHLLEEPNVRYLAQKLKVCLNKALPPKH
ncbi:thioesterase domain-containing protein, partial [Aetokthonos hydrillicola]